MATTYDKASLVMIPSGVKESKLYSIKPTDGSGDSTFSRGTDTATRVNASGLIEKERGNLVTYSNTFSNAVWVKSAANVTGGQTGYDGSSDAWALTPTATSGSHRVYHSSVGSSGIVTCSVYAKANGYSHLFIYANTSSGDDRAAWFDLSGGSVGTQTNKIIDATITSVGGGWYRCDVKQDNSLGLLELYVGDGENISFTGNGTSGILIQDAQVNQGLVAQPYIETTTAAVYEGITDNLPRLDYSGGASCPSLLLEPSRTNLLTHSEYIADWSQTNATTASNQATSPEGVNNASLSTATGSGAHAPYDTLAASVTSGANYTMSIFYKKGTTNYLRFEEGYTGIGIDIDIDAESATPRNGATNANIEDYGNSWYRASFGFTGHGSGSSQIVVYIKNSSDQTSYTASGESVYLYGAQLEAGSYPTSYIPTYGTSASRAADIPTISSGSSIFNDSEGTFYAEIEGLSDTTSTKVITIGDGTSSNRLQIFYQAGTNITTNLISGGSSQTTGFTTAATQTDNNKVLIRYASNNAKMYLNGAEIASDVSVTPPSGLNVLRFNNGTGAALFEGEVKQLLYFDTALTDAECIALTTL